MLKMKQRGDTIVEVLIASAVAGLVLVGAYTSVSRNTLANQDTQEHSQAQKIVESQIEFLRAAGGLPGSDTCFKNDSTPANGSACITSDPQKYHIGITSSSGVYKVAVTWVSLVGNSGTNANVTMFYRPD